MCDSTEFVRAIFIRVNLKSLFVKLQNLYSAVFEESIWNFQDMLLGPFREELSDKIFI